MQKIEPGERRITRWAKREIVAVEHHHPNGPNGGEVEFYFADLGPEDFQHRMSAKNWRAYDRPLY